MPDGTESNATVSVEIPVIPDVQETVEPPEQVTVITAPATSEGVDATTVHELLEQRERAVRAELRNTELEQQIAELQAGVATAQVTADIALENVQDAVMQVEQISEGDQISPESDVEPTREHAFWRNLR